MRWAARKAISRWITGAILAGMVAVFALTADRNEHLYAGQGAVPGEYLVIVPGLDPQDVVRCLEYIVDPYPYGIIFWSPPC